jgi:hypothetical protein
MKPIPSPSQYVRTSSLARFVTLYRFWTVAIGTISRAART